MKLYLLRHGHAPSTAEAGVTVDSERPLSDQGRADVRRTVQFLLSQGGRPALILHSPLLRAEQSAREAAALLKPAKSLEVFLPLSNAMPADQLYDELKAKAGGVSEVMAVGHQPQLGELAAFLCGHILELRAGGIITLELREDSGVRSLWSHNPGDA